MWQVRANQSQAFVNILHFTSRGGGKFVWGKVFAPKSANFDSFYSKLCKFLQVFPKFAQISTIFSKICANFDNFYQKRGKLFQKFSACGENILFWQNSHLCPELIFSRIFAYGGSWLSNNFTIFKAFLTVPYGKVSVSIFQLF